jgi:LytS/YehU family sensor histidine kinase
VEGIRFGHRLVVRADIDSAALDDCVPAFALQTLVENAIQHGAAHRVEPTEVAVTATRGASGLTLTVRNDTNGASVAGGTGTGLPRLRERLTVLYGGGARLASGAVAGGAFEAVLVVPRRNERDA